MTLTNILLGLFLTIYCGNSVSCSPVDKKLKVELIQVLFRHGARTPIDCESVLLGTNETLYQPWGFAQLTNQGMIQEYEIGRMLREHYGDFLPDLYNPRHVYAYASGVGRTKASLELVLAALYPPTKELRWNDQLDWLPIQIFSSPRPLDILVKSRFCPKFIQNVEELYVAPEMKVLMDEHAEIRETMKNLFGRPFDLGDIFCAHSALSVHKNMNLPLPHWHTDDIFAKLKKATEFYMDSLSYTPTLKRLNGGTFVRRMLENINKSNEEDSQRKVYLYSTHDKTLHAYASSHNLVLPTLPDYGSAIILEKLSDERKNLYVRLLLWTGEPKRLITLKLPNCAEACPLNEYIKIVNPVLPTDEEMLCLFQNLTPKDIENILITDVMTIDD